jgi:branched-chain amino acid transport system permease protein
MNNQLRKTYGGAVRIGLIWGAIAVFLCLVGLVGVFDKRSLIEGVISLGQVLFLLPGLGAGYVTARSASDQIPRRFLWLYMAGILSGLLEGAIVAIFVMIGKQINIRAVFITASPALYNILTFGRGLAGVWILPVSGALLGFIGVLIHLAPARIQRPVVRGLSGVLLAGLFAGLIRPLLIVWKSWPEALGRFYFGQTGVTPAGAVITFMVISGIIVFWSTRGKAVQTRIRQWPRGGQLALRWTFFGLALLLALSLPLFSGAFIAQVIVLISLNILMGLGLNITLGFAGLLDLGFVAFFAMGAYTVGLLTSYGEYGLAHLSFWAVLPIAVFVAFMVGAFLGLPVLRIRGDYLAIATLGFGEIVRLLAGSDFLGPWLGGPQGVIGIQKPCLGWLGPFQGVGIARVCNGLELGGPKEIYYLAVISALLLAFVATRLRDSRLGRAWMAIREDEDVAEALGVNLIQTKLLAYMLGASFAGLSGAIFGTLVGSIFASSMQLLVSINVVALVIVGGMGSIPGVVVGALALIGLPEAFREFSEYRLLFYGAALIAMMLAKPGGLLPSRIIQRELKVVEETEEEKPGGATISSTVANVE